MNFSGMKVPKFKSTIFKYLHYCNKNNTIYKNMAPCAGFWFLGLIFY